MVETLNSWAPVGEEDTKSSKEKIRDMQKDAIEELVKEKGITFPTEIRRELGLSKDRVYDLLWELVRENRVKRHQVPPVPCECFQKRIGEFWNMGIKGQGAFKRVSWFVHSSNECEYAK